MPEAGVYASSRARILRICESPGDARTMRVQVIEELRRVIGFDAYAWVLTDPATSVGVAPLADVPWLPELPRQLRSKYLTRVNRWTTLGGARVALLREATGGNLSQSRVWAEMLADYGVVDAASVVFEDRSVAGRSSNCGARVRRRDSAQPRRSSWLTSRSP